jgi:hypothetical protein
MAVTEQARLALRDAARATLGEEEGDTLMAITAPANTDLATRQDLERVQENIISSVELRIARSMSELRADMVRGDGELRADMARGDGELRTEIEKLRADMVRGDGELRAEIEKLRADMVGSLSALGQRIEGSANRTLRWVLATVLLAQGGTIGFLNLLLR